MEKRKIEGDIHLVNLLRWADHKPDRKFAWIMVMLIIMGFILLEVGALDRGFPTPKNLVISGWTKFQVQRGDTLWSIAKKYGESVDARLLIFLIQEKNNIGTIIYAEKTIFIPTAIKYQWDNNFAYPKNLRGEA